MTRAEIEAAERQRREKLADARRLARYQLALEAIPRMVFESDKDRLAQLALKEPTE